MSVAPNLCCDETEPNVLGLKPTWLGLKPSQNPQYHHRKNSVSNKVIGKKWVYSDSERSTLPITEGECSCKYGMVSFYKAG